MELSFLLRFTLELFLNSTLLNPNSNVFLSPWSVYSALSLTLTGTSGQTQQQLLSTMHLNEQWKQLNGNNQLFHQQLAQTLRFVGGLNDQQNNNSTTNINLANHLFIDKIYDSLKQSYLNIVKDAYQSEVTKVPFKSDTSSAINQINQWVEEKTNNKIKDLVDESMISHQTELVLANAVYFKGVWQREFNKSLTVEGIFYGINSKQTNIPMMHSTDKFPLKVLPDLNARILWIPFKGNQLYLSIILPDEQNGINNLEEKLSKMKNDNGIYKLFQIEEGMKNTKVDLKIPKIKLESELNIKDILEKQMGVRDLFSPTMADFTEMTSSSRLFVSDIVHKAFFEMNEDGAEAAAATAAVASFYTSLEVVRPVEFHANHPFLFAIIDGKQGLPLFIGSVKT